MIKKYIITYYIFYLVQPWGERIPVGKDNLILRECMLKNTDYVEGLVVYAGRHIYSCTWFGLVLH